MKTILIVDDNQMVVEIISLMLDKLGYRPISATSGQECLDILKESVPDLILLDVMMEPMDGWETLDHIIANPKTKNIPVMMMTAKPMEPSDVQDYCDHIAGYIVKPITLANLKAMLDAFMQWNESIGQCCKKMKEQGAGDSETAEFKHLSRSINVFDNLVAQMDNASESDTAKGNSFPGKGQPIPDFIETISAGRRRLGELKSRYHLN